MTKKVNKYKINSKYKIKIITYTKINLLQLGKNSIN